MHETVDGMLEEFEKAGISFQGCLYSFVFCLLVYAWSAYQASQTPLCVITLTSMALVTAYSMMARTSEVETTFPLYSIPLVSGAFFNKKAASGAPGGVLDPAASLRAELGAEAHAEQQRLVAEARAAFALQEAVKVRAVPGSLRAVRVNPNKKANAGGGRRVFRRLRALTLRFRALHAQG